MKKKSLIIINNINFWAWYMLTTILMCWIGCHRDLFPNDGYWITSLLIGLIAFKLNSYHND